MQKKSNGEGTVYYSESRKRWIGQVTVGTNENGKPKRRSVYGKTKKEALKKMLEIQSELTHGKYVDPSMITVEALMKSLIDDDRVLNIIKESSYNRKIATHKRIEPSELGQMPLQKVTETDIKKYLATITSYSDSVIHKDFELLKRTFNEAIKRDIISKSPMLQMKSPKSDHKTIPTRAFTISEQQKFIEALSNKSYNYTTQMKLMMLTGMRMGEVNALEVSDVNLNFKTISIRRTLTRDSSDKFEIGDTTKTYAGTRKIPISDTTVALIRDYMDSPEFVSNPENLLFWDRKSDKVVSTSQVNCQFKRILEKYEIIDPSVYGRVSLHSLRHTYATRCIESNMSAKVLQKLLGHSDIKITLNTYCDAFDELKTESISKFEQYLGEKNIAI